MTLRRFRFLLITAILGGLYGGAYLRAQQPPMLMYGVDTATGLTHPIKVASDGSITSGGVALGSTTSGTTGQLVMGAVTTSAPTYTTAQNNAFSLQTDGSLRVAITNGGGGGTSAADDADFTPTSTAITLVGCVVEASPTTVTDGDMGACGMTPKRSVKVTLTDSSGNFLTPGNDATHDSAAIATGPGIMMEARTTTGTAVTSGDAVRPIAQVDGIQVVRPHSLLENRVSGVSAITDGSSTSTVAAQGAGIRFCATLIIVSNSSATNVTVDIRDGTAGSVLMTIPAAGNMGGAVVPLQTPLCTTANTIFAADPSASASTVTTTAVGFKTSL